MPTHASLKGHDTIRELGGECQQLLLRIRDEKREHIIPIREKWAGWIVGLTIPLVLWLTILPLHKLNGEFNGAGLLLFGILGLFGGCLVFQLLGYLKGDREISDYLYLKLVALKAEYEDFSTITRGGRALTLSVLERLIMSLAMELKSEIEQPGRTEFLSMEKNHAKMFSFYPEEHY